MCAVQQAYGDAVYEEAPSLQSQITMSASSAIVTSAMLRTSVSGHLHQFHGMARPYLLVQLGCTSCLLGSSAMMRGSRVIYQVTVFLAPHHQGSRSRQPVISLHEQPNDRRVRQLHCKQIVHLACNQATVMLQQITLQRQLR
ncbi:hypothetical protein ABBQ38_005990 [Trebouxia sp. C0009 RCD-2024]